MSTYHELMEKKRALDIQIEQARRQEMGEAIEKVKAIVEMYELTPQDVFGVSVRGAGSVKEKKPVVVKYRNPATGETWTGRGKPPRWIAGVANRDEYLAA